MKEENIDILSYGQSQNPAFKAVDINLEESVGAQLHKQITDFDIDMLIQQMDTLSVYQLLTFLKVSHKYYLSKKLPEIEQSLLHITSSFSETHHLLKSLAFFFNDYKIKLIKHIRMEEKTVFPFIEKLMAADKNELSRDEISTLLANNTIQDFEDNHDPVEDELTEVSQVLFDYAEKADLPMSFSVFLNQVAFFEQELRKHAVIEDEVLLPKVLAVEKKLRGIS